MSSEQIEQDILMNNESQQPEEIIQEDNQQEQEQNISNQQPQENQKTLSENPEVSNETQESMQLQDRQIVPEEEEVEVEVEEGVQQDVLQSQIQEKINEQSKSQIENTNNHLDKESNETQDTNDLSPQNQNENISNENQDQQQQDQQEQNYGEQQEQNYGELQEQENQAQYTQIEVQGSVNSLQDNDHEETYQQQDINALLQQANTVKEETQDREEEIQQEYLQANDDIEQRCSANILQEEQTGQNQNNSFQQEQAIEEERNEVVKQEIGFLSNILSDDPNNRYTRISPELSPNIGSHFLGGKSLQLTNINDTSRLYMYFLGTKILRQLLNKANSKLKDIYKKTSEVKDYTIDEVQVYQALKIVMGLQQNSTNFDFFLLKDLQKIPPYCQLFTNERFQFLLDCERELNKDLLNNEQLITDFVQRAQISQTSDKELVLISKKNKAGEEIIHNNSVYTQVYLCELTSSFIFGYYVVKDLNSFANQICINLDNFINLNHHIYFQNEEFLSSVEKIQELIHNKIHFSSFISNKFDQIPQNIMNQMLQNKPIKPKSSEVIFDRQTQSQFFIQCDENSKKEVFLTTNGTVKQNSEKHKQAIQKIGEKLRKQLTDYRFVNIINEQQSIFEELSEIAIQNSFIIFTQAKEKMDYRLFRFRLAMELLQKQIQKLKQEELQNNKLKFVDVEVQTDKITDNHIVSPEKDTHQKSPLLNNLNNQNYSQLDNHIVPSFQMADQNLKMSHIQRKIDKQGICLVCLQEKNISNNTFITCNECTQQNQKPVYLCEKCFDAYHQDINTDRDFDKKNFSRLGALKNSISTVPIDKMPVRPIQNNNGYVNAAVNGNMQTINAQQIPLNNNGYNGYQPLQPQIRRRRNNLQDGYETSGPAFNTIPQQQPINGLGQNMPLKRRGPALDDPGFRSDAPSNYLAPTRGRKRLNAGQDQLAQRNQYAYNDIGQANNNGYGQNLMINSNGYDRNQRPVDLNGYTTSDPAYGRSYGDNGNSNNQIFRVVPTNRR